VCDIVVNKFTFAISSPDEFLSTIIVDCIVVIHWSVFHCKWTFYRHRSVSSADIDEVEDGDGELAMPRCNRHSVVTGEQQVRA